VDIETEDNEESGHKLSEKGRRMAASIAEFLLMRYFFPGMKDRKKQQKAKEDFMVDMKFDLSRGSIQKTTTKLGSRK
jgi:exonuclease III